MLRPRGLGELMELAQMIENKNIAERVNRSSSVGFSYRNSTPLVGKKKNPDFGVLARVPKQKPRLLGFSESSKAHHRKARKSK